jgi:hypothetical protein
VEAAEAHNKMVPLVSQQILRMAAAAARRTAETATTTAREAEEDRMEMLQ